MGLPPSLSRSPRPPEPEAILLILKGVLLGGLTPLQCPPAALPEWRGSGGTHTGAGCVASIPNLRTPSHLLPFSS